jgi:hypothetical protein
MAACRSGRQTTRNLRARARRDPVPCYKERAYWDFLKEQVGKPYDKLAIVAFAFNRDWRSPDALVLR